MEKEKMDLNQKQSIDLSIFSHIKVFRNILTESCAETLLQVCKNKFNDYQEAQIIKNNFESAVDRNVRDVSVFPLCRQNDDWTRTIWYKFFKSVFVTKAQEYSRMTCNHESIATICDDISILRYEKSGHYNFHVDHGRTTPRTLSAIYFVNDDFKGGELVFSDPTLQLFITIPPEKNTMVIWPSNFLYPHKVNAVTEGVRYTVVSWLT